MSVLDSKANDTSFDKSAFTKHKANVVVLRDQLVV